MRGAGTFLATISLPLHLRQVWTGLDNKSGFVATQLETIHGVLAHATTDEPQHMRWSGDVDMCNPWYIGGMCLICVNDLEMNQEAMKKEWRRRFLRLETGGGPDWNGNEGEGGSE